MVESFNRVLVTRFFSSGRSGQPVDWMLLGKALCLVAVIEGVAYALAPGGMRQAALLVSQMDEGSLRRSGVMVMAIGAALLFLLTH